MKSIELYRNIFKESAGYMGKRLVYFSEVSSRGPETPKDGPKETPKATTTKEAAKAEIRFMLAQTKNGLTGPDGKVPPGYAGLNGELTNAAKAAEEGIDENAEKNTDRVQSLEDYCAASTECADYESKLPKVNGMSFGNLKFLQDLGAESVINATKLAKAKENMPLSLRPKVDALIQRFQILEGAADKNAKTIKEHLAQKIHESAPIIAQLEKQYVTSEPGDKKEVSQNVDPLANGIETPKSDFNTLKTLEECLSGLNDLKRQLTGLTEYDSTEMGFKQQFLKEIDDNIHAIEECSQKLKANLDKKDQDASRKLDDLNNLKVQLAKATEQNDLKSMQALKIEIGKGTAWFNQYKLGNEVEENRATEQVLSRVITDTVPNLQDIQELEKAMTNLATARTVSVTLNQSPSQIDAKMKRLQKVITDAKAKFVSKAPEEFQNGYAKLKILQTTVAELEQKREKGSITEDEREDLRAFETEMNELARELRLPAQISNNDNIINDITRSKPDLKKDRENFGRLAKAAEYFQRDLVKNGTHDAEDLHSEDVKRELDRIRRMQIFMARENNDPDLNKYLALSEKENALSEAQKALNTWMTTRKTLDDKIAASINLPDQTPNGREQVFKEHPGLEIKDTELNSQRRTLEYALNQAQEALDDKNSPVDEQKIFEAPNPDDNQNLIVSGPKPVEQSPHS